MELHRHQKLGILCGDHGVRDRRPFGQGGWGVSEGRLRESWDSGPRVFNPQNPEPFRAGEPLLVPLYAARCISLHPTERNPALFLTLATVGG